ncbi:hypothetical protein E2C01_072208 [Portunus trituberculatus]|uniref:Uncharacterized protein n=1 Tax=Portunus trituberculatus TaxID=210409 RepID=A0A5B7I639_PORTR|nr:hypothetical protein [Portunus trituberculatus]
MLPPVVREAKWSHLVIVVARLATTQQILTRCLELIQLDYKCLVSYGAGGGGEGVGGRRKE